MIRICDVMHKGVIYCYLDDTAKEVAKMMTANQIRSIIVADENGEVWGLISNMDIISLYGKDLDKIRAEEIMKPYKLEIDPLMPIEKAIELMKKQRYEHLIIIDPNAGPKRPVGIISSFDIVQYMSGLKTGEYAQYLKMPDAEPRKVDSK